MDRLSSRGRMNVQAIIPHMPPSILNGLEDDEVVDMATAENWVVRDLLTGVSKEAITQTLEPKHLSWPVGFYGMTKLLDALAGFLNREVSPHAPVKADDITILPGANGCLMGNFWTLCEPGDGILIPTPYWFGFDIFGLVRAGVRMVEARVPSLPEAMSLQSVMSALETAYDNASVPIKALLISNPNNPMGVPWSRDVLEAMLKFCQAKDIHLISDEVFGSVSCDMPEVESPTPFTSILQLDVDELECDAWRRHAVWSPSKVFGMSGFRLGAVISPGADRSFRDSLALATMQEVSVLSSLTVLHTLTSPSLPAILAESSQALSEHYRLLTRALRELSIPYVPANAGLSLLVKIAPGAADWSDENEVVVALRERKVLVGAGKGYKIPEPGWARVSFGLPRDKLEEGIRRMREVLAPRYNSDRAVDMAEAMSRHARSLEAKVRETEVEA